MSTSDWIGLIGLTVAIMGTTIGSVWSLSAKIATIGANLDALTKRVDSLEKIVSNLVAAVTEMRIEMTEMQVKMDVLWRVYVAKSESPISLNANGEEMLEKSHIGSFANLYYHEILQQVRNFKPENAYQTQEILISIVGRYKKKDEHRLNLQEIAFQSGYDIDSLLLVAALSIRDRIVKDMGFSMQKLNKG